MQKCDRVPGSPRWFGRSMRLCGTAIIGLLGLPVLGAEAAGPYAPAINTLAETLAERYVDPAVGKQYAQTLRANLAAGRYDGITDAKMIAQRLTQDLQAVSADGHLRVDLVPTGAGLRGQSPDGPRRMEGPGPQPGSSPGAPAPTSTFNAIDLPSVAETKWIAEGIAYIRFNQFAGEPASVAAVTAFMKDYVSAKAIIIDTRTLARGGGLAEMDVMFPYLFERETVLVEMAVTSGGGPGGGPQPMRSATLRELSGPANLSRRQHVAIPHPGEHRLADAKVFYLTSKRTRSAAEHFALALQCTHRGVIVGERTAGANHFGGIEPIGAGLAAFIPVGRTYDPDTGKDWEGTGIVPDIEVPADEALDNALALAKG